MWKFGKPASSDRIIGTPATAPLFAVAIAGRGAGAGAVQLGCSGSPFLTDFCRISFPAASGKCISDD